MITITNNQQDRLWVEIQQDGIETYEYILHAGDQTVLDEVVQHRAHIIVRKPGFNDHVFDIDLAEGVADTTPEADRLVEIIAT